jgi:hypothetical protein
MGLMEGLIARCFKEVLGVTVRNHKRTLGWRAPATLEWGCFIKPCAPWTCMIGVAVVALAPLSLHLCPCTSVLAPLSLHLCPCTPAPALTAM